ncbi:hypothetical protein [Mesorhizobium sp.]|uniref:hypothetical protein n=1 Tax=Mesorhizobium sp. TaxID=1871066 RepID=UPI00120E9366|nr:hypothetical protein [Mesorhizobium sp.]TIX28936.1 MAG: hypothetical protein E5V35_00830 [Mesorhizobium sp.]
MTAAPYLLGRKGPGAAVIANDPGGGSGVTDGGFVEQPVVTTTASGNTTLKGKTKPGSFGKVVYPLATIAAGREYTFRYITHFAQLGQQGKLAMVGFGLKNGNDFHIVGLRGDGSTGLHKYQVDGTPPNGWNAQTGHTTSDGGASASGTQAGPNYIRLVVSADGATYKFQTSPDGATWTDEYTGQTPTPFSNVSGVTTFGLALWFNNADAGPFSIDIDQFADAAAPTGPIPVYQGTAEGNTGTICTYTNAPIGAASATRLVVAVVQVRRNANAVRTITGVTIGGNAASILVQTNVVDGVSSGITVGIASLVVASGTTATVVATFSGLGNNSAVSVYTIDGLLSNTATDTASATGNDASGSTLDVNANGLVIAGFAGAGGTLGDMTLTGVNENDDRDVLDVGTSLTHARFAAGSIGNLSSETNRTISVSSTANVEALAAASWA